MRHCDLFVGVASVANDPNWADGGPAAEHPNQWRRTIGADYWRTQAFGDLDAMAETRLALLTALLPSLAIGKVSRIIDGKLPARRGQAARLQDPSRLRQHPDGAERPVSLHRPGDAMPRVDLRLPFEGDNMLSIILSRRRCSPPTTRSPTAAS